MQRDPGQVVVRGRAHRAVVAQGLAARHGGVVHRRDLRAHGIMRAGVRTEVAAGRWSLAGRHTLVVGAPVATGEGLLWQAVWESGSGAVLDGVSALQAGGLRGFDADRIDVTVPSANRRYLRPGVRVRRRTDLGPVVEAGLPRTRPEWAAVRAAQWARTDRTAVLILCLVLQQRLVRPRGLVEAWSGLGHRGRPALVAATLADLCDGVRSLGELDFAALCRRHGIPEPTRQVVRDLPGGRVYLDVAWEGIGLVVEIDGGHHALALHTVDDALRQNEVVLDERRVLRIPVLGLRTDPARFMDQVARAHAALSQGRR